jgi:hypothetical protein
MNSTVELNCKATLGTAEVDDERTDWMLPAELHSIQTPSAQFFPQDVLNRCLAGAQVPRRGNIVPVLMLTRAHGKSLACQWR